MLIGFINSAGPPPPELPALPPDEPPDDGPEGGDTGVPAAAALAAARAATARFRRGASGGAGRYAWAISLAVHGVVLVGAFVAARFYLSRPAAKPATDAMGDASAVGAGPSGSLMLSPDVTDAVHGRWAGGDSPAVRVLRDGLASEQEVPPVIPREPQTIKTLAGMAPGSGMDDSAGAAARDAATQRRAFHPPGAATQPRTP